MIEPVAVTLWHWCDVAKELRTGELDTEYAYAVVVSDQLEVHTIGVHYDEVGGRNIGDNCTTVWSWKGGGTGSLVEMSWVFWSFRTTRVCEID